MKGIGITRLSLQNFLHVGPPEFTGRKLSYFNHLKVHKILKTAVCYRQRTWLWKLVAKALKQETNSSWLLIIFACFFSFNMWSGKQMFTLTLKEKPPRVLVSGPKTYWLNVRPTVCMLPPPGRRQALWVQPVSEAFHEERPPDEALQDTHKHQEPVSGPTTDSLKWAGPRGSSQTLPVRGRKTPG